MREVKAGEGIKASIARVKKVTSLKDGSVDGKATMYKSGKNGNSHEMKDVAERGERGLSCRVAGRGVA